MNTLEAQKALTSLPTLITALSAAQAQKQDIDQKIDEIRAGIAEIMKQNALKTYKDDSFTVSKVVKKTIKYDKDAMLKYLQDNKIVLYMETIPEHVEIKSDLDQDIKEGKFTPRGVEVEISEKESLAIRLK